jgi:membrane-associated phospholipid phosphatase
VSSITQPAQQTIRLSSLKLLAAYVGVAGGAAVWRVAVGNGSIAAVGVYATIAVLGLYGWRGRSSAAGVVGDWLPLLALPALYLAIPATTPHAGRMFDGVIQSWDATLFGTQPSRTLAGVIPSLILSETLHAAYMSYYGIIYLPPLLMYLTGGRDAFYRSVRVFTVVMVVCFVVFCLFPVAGPRFEWGGPSGVPDGPVRRATLVILERGSARGTAFPSSHIAIALSMALSAVEWRPRFGGLVLVVTMLLGLGAVYGGFHYGIDMLAGAATGLACWWMIRKSRQAEAVVARPTMRPV